jgi:hypothetical protein
MKHDNRQILHKVVQQHFDAICKQFRSVEQISKDDTSYAITIYGSFANKKLTINLKDAHLNKELYDALVLKYTIIY